MTDSDLYQFADFDGVEYQAQNSGRTALIQPTFDPVINHTTVDGDVTWKAVLPTHTFYGTVSAVTNYTTFTATGLSSRASHWFDFGVLKWLTGPNAGRSIECKTFTNPGSIITMLPLAYQPSVGEKFMIHTGCDKGRDTCATKFNNILNFRGEPDLPGTGQYFKVAGG
jgi:uncharacterized phage protein (TIGR02218 family)